MPAGSSAARGPKEPREDVWRLRRVARSVRGPRPEISLQQRGRSAPARRPYRVDRGSRASKCTARAAPSSATSTARVRRQVIRTSSKSMSHPKAAA